MTIGELKAVIDEILTEVPGLAAQQVLVADTTGSRASAIDDYGIDKEVGILILNCAFKDMPEDKK